MILYCILCRCMCLLEIGIRIRHDDLFLYVLMTIPCSSLVIEAFLDCIGYLTISYIGDALPLHHIVHYLCALYCESALP